MVQNLIGSLGSTGAVIENIDWLGLLESLATALVSIIVQIPSIIVGAIGGISDLLASLFEAIGSILSPVSFVESETQCATRVRG